jgi:hypothetical protein
MEYVPERIELTITPPGCHVPLELGSVGLAAADRWCQALANVGRVEVIDDRGEIIAKE